MLSDTENNTKHTGVANSNNDMRVNIFFLEKIRKFQHKI